jgi:hypothetical protein
VCSCQSVGFVDVQSASLFRNHVVVEGMMPTLVHSKKFMGSNFIEVLQALYLNTVVPFIAV